MSSVHRRKPVLRQHYGGFQAVSFSHPELASRNQIACQVQLLKCVHALQTRVLLVAWQTCSLPGNCQSAMQ